MLREHLQDVVQEQVLAEPEADLQDADQEEALVFPKLKPRIKF